MRQSKLFTKISKTPPAGEESVNAMLLEQAGFVQKTMAGVYSFLPLGLKVINKIENIVREEMNAIGGEEILMPALQPKEFWESTGRWQTFDALFRLKSRSGSDYALGPTHEEILFPMLTHHLNSYKDLPICVYQIQTKFRDEPRAKSGLLRGREFRMKDFYSFHSNDEERNSYYNKVKEAYKNIFKKLELDVLETEASGGTFSDLSLEFQVVSPVGEDSIYICKNCHIAINEEIAHGAPKCKRCGGELKKERAIEVGNIFPLKTKYAEDFNLRFKDKDGNSKLVSAGCYGLGTSRVMGTITELYHDEKGLIWPKSIAPFSVHLLDLGENKKSNEIYDALIKEGVEVLYDDREEKTAGEKFADADLIGIPTRIVASKKTLEQKSVEIKSRGSKNTEYVKIGNINSYV